MGGNTSVHGACTDVRHVVHCMQHFGSRCSTGHSTKSCAGHSVHYVMEQFWTSDILAICQAVFTGRSVHVVHGPCIMIDILAVLNEWYSSCLSSSICRPFCTCWILAVYQACDLHPPFNCPIGWSFSRRSDCVKWWQGRDGRLEVTC